MVKATSEAKAGKISYHGYDRYEDVYRFFVSIDIMLKVTYNSKGTSVLLLLSQQTEFFFFSG